MEKLNDYQGWTGRLHGIRDNLKDKWRESDNTSQGSFIQMLISNFVPVSKGEEAGLTGKSDYSHVYR